MTNPLPAEASRLALSIVADHRWLIAAAVTLAGVSVAAVQAARFYNHLEVLRMAVVGNAGQSPAARNDLPPEVAALASALGAQAGTATVELKQSGQMWSAPGSSPMQFKARQTAATERLDYIWNADMGPFGLVKAADYYVDGVGGLEVRVAGLLTIEHEVGTPEMAQGEALRYLAELPWNPDAILLNRSLHWTVINPTTLRVAQGDAAITFVLGADGLPQSMSAPARVYMGKQGRRVVPWRGRFGGYERREGRLIPGEGEVAWVLDGREFVYWRGRLTAWSAIPASAQ